MAMDISAAASMYNQETSSQRGQTGFDVLTRTGDKTEQTMQNDQLRLEIAEQTGKGLNLDVQA